jgi:hypothetical protein
MIRIIECHSQDEEEVSEDVKLFRNAFIKNILIRVNLRKRRIKI